MAKILVIDDEETIRAFVGAVLEEQQHTIIEACDGKEGLALFEEHKPDIIITDLNMPNLTGWELISKIRAKNTRVKIIAMSSILNGAEECNLLLKAGANRCLPKPVSIATLERSVENLLVRQCAATA
jgi:phosphoserine phosphatase RsbU/P